MTMFRVAVWGWLLAASAFGGEAAPQSLEAPRGAKVRKFAFTYEAIVKEVPAGTKKLEVWLPVPQNNTHQVITNLKFAPEPHKVESDKAGNSFAYWRFKEAEAKPLSVTLTFDCERHEIAAAGLANGRALNERERSSLKNYLEPDHLVPVGSEFQAITTEAVGKAEAPHEIAKSAYNYVYSSMAYGKPEGKAWGRGDTWYACKEGVGNCTDFHALFMSIGRTAGIPVKFEMGFPLPEPEKGKEGKIGGYHCWAKFYLGDIGWVPVDISEAWKHRELVSYYYGNLTADRVQFTTGRDIELKPGFDGKKPLFFIYPIAEADDKELKIDKAFSFKDL